MYNLLFKFEMNIFYLNNATLKTNILYIKVF